MTEALVIKIAEELTEYLNTQTVEGPLQAELMLVPDFDLSAIRTRRVVVTPNKLVSQCATRGDSDRTVEIAVGLIQRAKTADIRELLQRLEAIGDLLEKARLSSGRCVAIKYDPLYDVASLLQKGAFIGVCTATIRVIA